MQTEITPLKPLKQQLFLLNQPQGPALPASAGQKACGTVVLCGTGVFRTYLPLLDSERGDKGSPSQTVSLFQFFSLNITHLCTHSWTTWLSFPALPLKQAPGRLLEEETTFG